MGACPRLLLSLVLSIGLFAQADVNGQTMGPNLSGSYTQTLLHYTANGNINGKGVYLPGADGFNLADVSSVGSLDALPAGVKGLVYLDACGGATASFTRRVKQFKNKPKLFGFYLMDEPDPGSCRARNLKAEADWIHANVPGAETFIVLMNMSSDTTPTFKNTYNPANTDVDLFGLDPYPCQQQFNGCDYRIIPAAIAAAEAWGISASQIVPVYQAFGGGGYSAWLMPTAAEETQLLATWASAIPAAVFDYVYSWGVQSSDQALSTAPDLQAVFLQKNTGQ
jgi:hypothetical protein